MRIHIPTECPSCASILSRVNDQLFCTNDYCEAKVDKQAEKFAKALKIKGLGPKAVEALNLDSFESFLYFPETYFKSCLGDKIGEKVYTEVQHAISNATLAQVIEGLPIKGVGATSAQKLASVVSSLEDIDADACKAAGLGTVQTNSIVDWLDNNYVELPFKYVSVSTPSTGETVCITGKLNDYKTKALAEEALKSYGYRIVDSVTKTTDFLVDESGKSSAKFTKAVSLQIPIVTIKELIERKL